ncbi:hypothetical protein HXX76_009283 [Chlamydomonas incerta]|uniref:Uncharacterized protein n=1 Tax=Chlamydomonas incerta TaxID=51695 RepID=A0A835VWC1_CHLIN|nr:hypothetical protein HXX76_009283 [Chlamydomonas incerta]|eukprot:KAG2431787.1 hypothetical protein HXX76_009283 [Chlamydomonas incerta]
MLKEAPMVIPGALLLLLASVGLAAAAATAGALLTLPPPDLECKLALIGDCTPDTCLGAAALCERSSGADDWGLTFSGLRHLRLVNSTISGVPLTSIGPLLRCLDCAAVSVANLTVQSVYGSANAADPAAAPPRTGLWGVLHASGVQRAHLTGLQCVGVIGATGWSCLRLELAASSSGSSDNGWAGAEVWLEDSVLADSSVVWRGSDPTYGAVGLTAQAGSTAVRLNLHNTRIDNHTSRGPDCQAAGIAVVAPLTLDRLVLNASSISDNRAVSCRAGAVFVQGSGTQSSVQSIVLDSGSSCSRNLAERGEGGACLRVTDSPVLSLRLSGGSQVDNNRATAAGDGGALRFTHLDELAVVGGSSISGNTASGGAGGAIHSQGLGDARNLSSVSVLDGSRINNNRASQGGGALWTSSRVGAVAVGGGGSSMDDNYAGGEDGGAFRLGHLGALEVTDGSSVSGNTAAAGRGGAVFAQGVWEWRVERLLVANGSRMDGNWAAQAGGAFWTNIPISDLMVASNSSVSNNTANSGDGGAVRCRHFDAVELTRSSNITLNRALNGGRGGALFADGMGDQRNTTLISVTDHSHLDSNQAALAGGAVFAGTSRVLGLAVAGGSSIDANAAAGTDGGGGLKLQHLGALEVTDGSSVSGNTAAAGRGGAVSAEGVWEWRVERVLVSGGSRMDSNSAGQEGGALHFNIPVTEFQVSLNSSVSNNTGSEGGAMRCRHVGSVAVSGASSVSLNRAAGKNGGVIYSWDNMGGSEDTGAIAISGSSRVDSNSAAEGGGAIALQTAVQQVSVSNGSSLSGNVARSGNGGAIRVRHVGALVVEGGSSVSNNSAVDGAGRGGALFADGMGDQRNVTLFAVRDRSHMDGNQARQAGGAIAAWVQLEGLEISGSSSMDGNAAAGPDGGGALRVRHLGRMDVTDSSSVSGNTAAAGRGGAVSAEGVWEWRVERLLVANGSRMDGNWAAQAGGAFWTNIPLTEFQVLNQSSVSNNTGSEGGAVRCRHVVGVALAGGSSGSFNNATSGSGGLLLAGDYINGMEERALVISGGSRVDGNTAAQQGGAIATQSVFLRVAVSNGSSLSGNVATSGDGGAIRVRHADVVVVEGDSIVTNSSARTGAGGAFFIESPDASQRNITLIAVSGRSRMDSNRAFAGGGALFTRGRVEALIVSDSSSVDANFAENENGGALRMQHLSQLDVTNGSSVSANTAAGLSWGGEGGAVHAEGVWEWRVERLLVANGSRMDGNWAAQAGGAFFTRIPINIVQVTAGSSVSANTANSSDGGALRCRHAGSIVITGNSSVSSNRAFKGRGGALMLEGIDGVKVARVEVSGGSRLDSNIARNGGALGTEARISLVMLSDGGSMSSNNATSEQGGGIKARRLDQLLVTGGSHADNNSALYAEGGAFHFWDTDAAGNDTVVTVSDRSTISGNFAGRGGAALWVGSTVAGFSVTHGSCVCDNAAGGTDDPNKPGEKLRADSGGAVAFGRRVGSIAVTHGSCMCRNRIITGNRGGAFSLQQGVDSISICHASQVSNNTAAGDSGAFYTRADTPAYALGAFTVCNGSAVDFNQAMGAYGGAFMAEGRLGNFSITNSSISSNKASLRGGAMHFNFLPDAFLLRDSRSVNNTVVFEQGAFLYMRVSAADWTSDPYLEKAVPGGPFSLEIINSNVSANSGYKAGALAIYLDGGIMTLDDAAERVRLRLAKHLYVNITNSTLNDNSALQGSGGALTIQNVIYQDTNQQRVASVNLGVSILIDRTELSNNQAGTFRRKLDSIPDIAGVNGIGGAVFVWAQIVTWRSGPPYNDSALSWPVDICNSSRSSSGYRNPMPLDDLGEAWPAATEPCRLLVRDSVLQNNTAVSGWGGGIMLAACAARVVNSAFVNNTAGIPGGGLALLEYDVPRSGYDPLGPCLDGVPMFGNGVFPRQLMNGSSSSLNSSSRTTTIANGTSHGSGRHLLQQQARTTQTTSPQLAAPRWLVLDNVTLEGNMALEGAGVYLEVNRTAALLKRCRFISNFASTVGGGVRGIVSSTLPEAVVITESTFEGNTAQISGGGISMELTATGSAAVTAALSANHLERNTARVGGGLHLTLSSSTAVRLADNTASGNSAIALGGGLYLEHSASNPNVTQQQQQLVNATAAAALYTTPAVAVITGGSWAGNKAASSGGGAFILARPEMDVSSSGSAWTQNAALSGAGLYVDVTQGGRVRLANVSLSDNAAAYQGGGVYLLGSSYGDGCGGQLVLENVTLARNRGGLRGGGASVATLTSVPTVSGSVNATAASLVVLGGGESSSAVRAGVASTTAANASTTAAACDSPGPLLVLSHSTVTDNRALSGGGVWQAPAVIMTVADSTFSGNEATLSGGAIASLECGLLSVTSSSFLGNAAGLSGGALYVDTCRVVWLSQSDVLQNRALAGGGVHLMGLRSGAVTAAAVSSRSAGLDAVAPVAVLSRVVLSGNSAYYGDTADAATAALSQLDSSSSAGGDASDVAAAAAADSALLREVQPYVAHGGGVLINGRVSVAMSKSRLTAQNSAKAGSIVASSQVCDPSSATAVLSGAGPGVSSSLEQLKGLLGDQWLQATLALQRATASYCSLLTISNSRLAGTYNGTAAAIAAGDSLPSTAEPAPADTAAAAAVAATTEPASVTEPVTPPLWLRDSRASALRARCSSVAEASAASASAGRRLTQSTNPTTQGGASSAADSAAESNTIVDLAAASTSSGTVASRRSSNIADLETCMQEGPQAEAGATRSIIAVPAASMRILSIAGATALVRLSNGTVRARGATGNNSPAAQFGAEEVVVALLVSPGEPFDIKVQLMDETGQPVTIDVPAYSISLAIQPNASVKYDARPALSLHGVASWSEIDMVGWPGTYSLRVDALVVSSGGSSSAASASLSQVQALELPLELLRCELGAEVEGPDLESDPAYFTTCRRCRQSQVGLWKDDRTSISSGSGSGVSVSSRAANSSTISASRASVWTHETLSNVNNLCAPCPDAAICPGAAIAVPKPGYWHSSMHSPAFHACPNSAACGDNPEVNATAWAAAPAAVSSLSAVATSALASEMLVDFSFIASDARSAALALCQQWWAANFPPHRIEAVLARNGSLVPSAPPPCSASDLDAALASGTIAQLLPAATAVYTVSRGEGYQAPQPAAPPSYMQMQCAEGYTGQLCATCAPGYSLNTEYQCNECVSKAQTVALGLITFFATVILILYTIFSNFQQSTAEAIEAHEVSATDLIKVFITHVQYFIIITRLAIDYPPVIHNTQSVLSSLTGAENLVAYSPTCMFEDISSAGQAAVSVIFGFATPILAGVLAVTLWAIRYLLYNQRIMARAGAIRGSARDFKIGSMARGADPGDCLGCPAAEQAPVVAAVGHGDGSSVVAQGRAAAGSFPSGNWYNGAASGGGYGGGAESDSSPHVAVMVDTALGGITAAAHAQPDQPGHLADATEAGQQSVRSAGGGQNGAAAAAAAPRAVCEAAEESPPDSDAAAADSNNRFVASALYPQLPSPPRSLPLPSISTIPQGPAARDIPTAAFSNIGKGLRVPHPTCDGAAAALAAAIAPPAPAAVNPRWSLTGQLTDVMSRLRSLRNRTNRSLSYADQALSLSQQMGVGLIVAAFILYPSLCQVTLSLFACYVIDAGNTGDELGSEYLTATWVRGFWTRNMNQQCYSGEHMRVYVPIGIVAIGVFCLAPPAAFFAVTFTNRKRLDDLDVTAKYGFLYAEYRPEWCWWSAVMQLQTLSLVAVEVFGRAMSTLHQSLALLAVLILNSGITMACSPVQHRLVMVCEFISFCVLSLTVTLSLYFLDTPPALSDSAANAVGIIIVVVNVLALFGFITIVFRFSGMKLMENAKASAGMAKVKGWASSATSALGRCASCHRRQQGTLVGGQGPVDKL